MSETISLAVPEMKEFRCRRNFYFFTKISKFHMSTGQTMTPMILQTPNSTKSKIFNSKFPHQIRNNSQIRETQFSETFTSISACKK